MLSHCSRVGLFATLWAVAGQIPLPMGFSRQEYWSRLPCPPSRGSSRRRDQPLLLMSRALADGFFTTNATWRALLRSRSWEKWAPLHPHKPPSFALYALYGTMEFKSLPVQEGNEFLLSLSKAREWLPCLFSPRVVGGGASGEGWLFHRFLLPGGLEVCLAGEGTGTRVGAESGRHWPYAFAQRMWPWILPPPTPAWRFPRMAKACPHAGRRQAQRGPTLGGSRSRRASWAGSASPQAAITGRCTWAAAAAGSSACVWPRCRVQGMLAWARLLATGWWGCGTAASTSS